MSFHPQHCRSVDFRAREGSRGGNRSGLFEGESNSGSIRVWGVLAVSLGLAVVLAAGALWVYQQSSHVSLRDELETRAAEIAALEVARSGSIRVKVVRPLQEPAAAPLVKFRYELHAPWVEAEDTEIRGLLDGTAKHFFNQGTAFHIRLGRRYTGLFDGQFELKRGLYKWPLGIPAYASVLDAEASFWVESFFEDSPLAAGHALPLHVYAYPLIDDWGPGKGGIERDTLSEAAPGESNWVTPRNGFREWPAPGALLRHVGENGEHAVTPLGMGVVVEGERPLRIAGDGLRQFVQQCVEQGRTCDLLLKLDDSEEDTAGTQFALLTCDFGDNFDTPTKRPTLTVEVGVRGAQSLDEELPFLLEEGGECITRRYELDADEGQVLIGYDSLLSLQPHQHHPEVWVRGGLRGSQSASDWMFLRNPLEREWQWVQFKISAAVRRVNLGDPFRAELLEPWVKPGPRQQQVPLMLAIAPSGKEHWIAGRDVGELRYRMEFVPDEEGVWRYAWSFHAEPISAPFSHQGQGLFTISIPAPRDAGELRQLAQQLLDSLDGKEVSHLSDQRRINRFVRIAADFGARGPAEREQMQEILAEVKPQLPRRYSADD